MSCARLAGLAVAALLVAPATASAELQVKPFVGMSFAASTTLVDVGEGSDNRHFVIGASVLYLGEIFGVEAEAAQISGFFEGPSTRGAVRSGVSTVNGSVVVAMPRRLAQYSLRPYAAAGFGLLRATSQTAQQGVFDFSANMGALNVGGGVTGFLTDRFGIGWDLRYFRRVSGGPGEVGLTFGETQLSFWRAYMAIVVR